MGTVLWKRVEQVRDTGKHPAIAAAPEQLAALLVTALEEAAVAEKELLDRVVEKIRGCPEFLQRELCITRVAGLLRQVDPGRWRHEQGIAPAPATQACSLFVVLLGVETQMHIRGPGENGIEAGAQRSDGLRAGPLARGPEITLRDHVIVSVVEPRTRRPRVRATHVENGAAETLLAADIGEACHADPESALFPALWVARFFLEVCDVRGVHVRELPVGDARSEGEHFLACRGFGSEGRDSHYGH